jgi:hypothetical protein
MVPAPWIALGCAALLVVAWLALRRPTILVWIVLATFAVAPQWVLAGEVSPVLLAAATPVQMLLLAAALLASGLRYGLRLDVVNWPLLAVLWLLAQSLMLANLNPAITPLAWSAATLGFALPWCLIHVALQPGSRARYALVIALLPLLCVALGAGLDLLEAHTLFSGSKGRGVRLRGATNAGWLAFLSFIGFAVALHEASRRRRLDFAALAVFERRDHPLERRAHGADRVRDPERELCAADTGAPHQGSAPRADRGARGGRRGSGGRPAAADPRAGAASRAAPRS